MIRLFLISALCGGLALRGHTQSISTWIEELAALQTLQRTIQDGYRIVTGGIQTIGTIRWREYQLHNGYVDGLDSVRPAIDYDPKVQALRNRLDALERQIRSALDYWQHQPILSP